VQLFGLIQDNGVTTRATPRSQTTSAESVYHARLENDSIVEYGIQDTRLSPLLVPFNGPSKLVRFLSGTGADWSPTARVQRGYKCSVQARSYFCSKGGLVDPQLRVSNEHIPIVRVPRAKRTTRLPNSALRFPQSPS